MQPRESALSANDRDDNRKHHSRLGREDCRQVLSKAMPKMLADGGQKSPKEEMLEILERTSARTWKRDGTRRPGPLGGL